MMNSGERETNSNIIITVTHSQLYGVDNVLALFSYILELLFTFSATKCVLSKVNHLSLLQ